MSSPLGLTDYSTIKYSPDVNDSNYIGEYNSIFNGTKFYYRPTIGNGGKTAISKKRHNSGSDDLYDVSINSILNYTNDPKLKAMKLKASDFVYLKDFGVYPNNRLVICRRFPSPVENDLTSMGEDVEPLSTIVSWIPDSQENFFTFQAYEEWVKGEDVNDPIQELSDMFNDVFGKVIKGSNLLPGMDSFSSKVANKFPMGGVAEALNTEIMNYFLKDENNDGTNFNYDNLHRGNPNFMGESSYRKINSIRSSIEFTVTSVYEMKYINGIDPTIAYMDILQNILRFSSSQSVFYLSQAGGDKIKKFINDFKEGKWIDAIKTVLDSIISAVKGIVKSISNIAKGAIDKVENVIKDGKLEDSVAHSVETALSVVSRSALSRYRIKFHRLVPAMTGLSSTPWHVTIGNPKNPFFSSGDMIVSGTTIKFGNTLGFNDIPTRMEISFKIQSARNLGIQEIFDRFNIGAGRQYQNKSIIFKTDFNQGRIEAQSKK